MDALRKETDDEIKRTRLDKTRLYNLLVKTIVSVVVRVVQVVKDPRAPPALLAPLVPPVFVSVPAPTSDFSRPELFRPELFFLRNFFYCRRHLFCPD